MTKRRPFHAPGLRSPVEARPASVVSPEVVLRRGFAAFQTGDYTTAIQHWEQARRSWPSAAGAIRALAEAYFRRALATTNPSRRVQDLHAAVALVPGRAIYQFHLGLAYQRQGQLRRALPAFEAAHRLAPDDDRCRYQLALALLADPAQAGRARDLLATARTDSEPVVRLRALADLRENKPAEAIQSLAALPSPSLRARLALGLAQLVAGQNEPASASLAVVRRSRQALATELRPIAVLASALAHLRLGHLDGALTLLKHQEPPEAGVARHAFAVVYRRLATEALLDERLDESLAAWQQALAAEPNHEPTRRCLGHLCELAGTRALRRGAIASAARHWESALSYQVAGQPASDRVIRNLALARERLERWREASALWEELVQRWKRELKGRGSGDVAGLRGRLEAAYRHLATTYEAAGDLHAAAQALERALHLDASDVDLRLRLAGLYLDSQAYGNAIEQLRRALTARPNDTRILVDLGSAFDLKGDDRQALAYLEHALALEPSNAGVKASLASVCHGRAHRLIDAGLSARAVAEFERAAEMAPTDPDHPRCLGELHLKLGQVDAAEASFSRAIALAPKEPAMRVTIGSAYLDHGYADRAEKLFRQALRLQRNELVQTLIGLTYLRHNELAKAEPYLKRVLKGRLPELLALIGDAYIAVGQVSEAIPYLERAVLLDPTHLEGRLALAYAYAVGHGDHARAAKELSRAEEIATTVGDDHSLAVIATARQANERLAEAERLADPGPPTGG